MKVLQFFQELYYAYFIKILKPNMYFTLKMGSDVHYGFISHN